MIRRYRAAVAAAALALALSACGSGTRSPYGGSTAASGTRPLIERHATAQARFAAGGGCRDRHDRRGG